MAKAPIKEGWKNIQIRTFPGFYESMLDSMITDELESTFSDDGGGSSNVPDKIYSGDPDFAIDFSPIHESQARWYCEAFFDQFFNTTGIKLEYEYETYTSPRYYNFESDRLFAYITDASVAALFTASEADNHKQLEEWIKAEFTSRDGFISYYSNDLGDWLAQPVLTWDHNELGTLLLAVLSIHTNLDKDHAFDTWSLMEDYVCNGRLGNDVWDAMPPRLREFQEAQSEFVKETGEFADFDLWVETGECYKLGTEREEIPELPPRPCKLTLDLFKENNYA